MKASIKYTLLFFLGIAPIGFFILKAQNFQTLENMENPSEKWSQDQLEIKATVERFLAAAGNYDAKAIEEMLLKDANIGIARLRDGMWSTQTKKAQDFLESLKTGDKQPYFEPVSEYTILVSDGHLAIVRADATLHGFGIPLTRNLDNFTLLKADDGTWKFVNLSYSSTRIPENQKKFDIEAFAKGYNQAWCSQNPEFVAQFFAESGSLKVNDGEPAVGRTSIEKVVNGFMTAFPDLALTCDAVIHTEEGTEFHWTFTGTNTGPGGTGNKVKFSGMEIWHLADDGRIKISDGHFDAEEYNEQVENGVKE